jgi:hypothetical protein
MPADHDYSGLLIQNQVTRHLLVNNEFAMMMALVALAGCGNRNKVVHHEDDMAMTRKTQALLLDQKFYVIRPIILRVETRCRIIPMVICDSSVTILIKLFDYDRHGSKACQRSFRICQC